MKHNKYYTVYDIYYIIYNKHKINSNLEPLYTKNLNTPLVSCGEWWFNS